MHLYKLGPSTYIPIELPRNASLTDHYESESSKFILLFILSPNSTLLLDHPDGCFMAFRRCCQKDILAMLFLSERSFYDKIL